MTAVKTVTLSGTTYPANAPVGTVIGTVSVTMDDGSAFVGALTLSDNANFKLVGTQVQARITLGAGPYPLTITATPNFSGSSGVLSITQRPVVQPESPDGTDITTVGPSINASPTPGTAGSGNVIAITPSGAISVNGATIGGALVVELYYTNHTAYQRNSQNNWYGPITATSTGAGIANPKPAPPPPPPPSGGPVDPPALAGLGYTVKFFDDFTSASTIATAGNSADVAPINWFPYSSPENYNLLTTAHAADIGLSDWNRHPATGQPNASAAGGIIEILSAAGGFNDCFQTVPHVLNNGHGRNMWKHGYFECYVQFNANGKPTQGNWPAFWSWSDTGKIEIDFLEYGNGPSFPASTTNTWVFNVWDPGGGSGNHTGGTMYGGATNDSDWHTIGCWWKSTGPGTGTLDFYFDNVHKAGPFATGAGTRVPDIENEPTGIYLIIGSGVGWPARWDWVRVWQAP